MKFLKFFSSRTVLNLKISLRSNAEKILRIAYFTKKFQTVNVGILNFRIFYVKLLSKRLTIYNQVINLVFLTMPQEKSHKEKHNINKNNNDNNFYFYFVIIAR